MIEYDKHSMTMDVYCDGRDGDSCDEVVTVYGSWSQCIEQIKEEGWICFKDANGDWAHRCPTCKTTRIDELFRD